MKTLNYTVKFVKTSGVSPLATTQFYQFQKVSKVELSHCHKICGSEREKIMLKDYPKNYVKSESGCKVGWLTYKNQEDASECSKIAFDNAMYLMTKGYEFGYSSPGAITETDQGFRVTIP
jgi:hypothetical protein